MAAIYKGSTDANQEAVYQTLPVASGVTVTAGDFVYWSSGRVTSASITGARLIGQADTTVTGNAGGTNKVMVNVTPNAKYLVKNDNIGTTFGVTHVGQYFDLIGATGAQLIDTSTVSATTNTMYCIAFQPNISPFANDATYGLFLIAEHAFKL